MCRASVAATVLALTASAVATRDTRYCAARYNRLCQGKGLHIACQYPVPGPAASCQNYTAVNFTPELKQFITNYINKRRQRIAAGRERLRGGVTLPRPQLMMFVAWDRELAMLAQRLADQCNFAHDDCRATMRYPFAGQTVGEVRWRRASGAGVAPKQLVRRVLDAWWGERRRVDARQLVQPFRIDDRGSVWGHFSQLCVWSLRAVGCGAVLHGGARLLLVCDFSHTNMLGQRTLTPGPPARCPGLTERRPRSPYPLLCAPLEILVPPTTREPHKTPEDEYADYSHDDTQHEMTQASADTTRKYMQGQKQTAYTDPNDFLRQELRTRTKGEEQNMDLNYRRKPHIKQFEKETFQEETLLNIDYVTELEENIDPNAIEVYKNTRENYTRVTTSENSEKPRHKWQSTRTRPRRPGVQALLKANTRPKQQKTIISLSLDKEDMDQLYRDTGFKIN